jgi:hypothetical protein
MDQQLTLLLKVSKPSGLHRWLVVGYQDDLRRKLVSQLHDLFEGRLVTAIRSNAVSVVQDLGDQVIAAEIFRHTANTGLFPILGHIIGKISLQHFVELLGRL